MIGTAKILPILQPTSWSATVSWMLTEEQETPGSETKDLLLLVHQAAWTSHSHQFSLSLKFHQFSSVQFNHSVVSNSLRPHELQHTRLLCPTPRAPSNSCPLSQRFHPTISSSVIPFFCLQSFPASRSFPNESVLRIRWPQFLCFSISLSNEYSGQISFRIDWLDLFVVQETIKSLLQHHCLKASILQCSAFFIVQLSHPYMGDSEWPRVMLHAQWVCVIAKRPWEPNLLQANPFPKWRCCFYYWTFLKVPSAPKGDTTSTI